MKQYDDTQTKDITQALQPFTTEQDKPILSVDYEQYTQYLENSELTDEQRKALLETIWRIVVEFVAMGWGVHPVQQAQKPCGKENKAPPDSPMTASDSVYLGHQYLSENLNTRTDLETDAAEEGVKA